MEYVDVRWWEEGVGESEVVDRLRASVEACEETDRNRRADILHRVRMYGNRAFAGLRLSDYHRVTHTRRGRLNIVKAVCDTAINRLFGNRPKPTPLPIGASNWSIRRKARTLDRFLQGQFQVSRARERMTDALADAVMVGDGLVKVSEDGRQIVLERTFSADLSVPPLEARGGSPLTLYQRHYVDRGVLEALYPSHKAAIRDADRASTDDEWWSTGIDTRADQIEVTEGWRLPSITGAKDGRHVVAIAGAVLRSETWEHDYFPFVHVAWGKPYFGMWSDSLVDVVEGQQIEINRLVAKLARGNDLGGHTIIWAPMGAEDKFNKRKMTNEIFTVVPFAGERPRLETIHGVSPEVRSQIQEHWDEAFRLAGLYETGREGIPAGLESGEALSRYNDLGAIRFRRFAERFEAAHIDLARMVIDCARRLAKKRGGDFGVPSAKDRWSLSRVPWSEVDMDDDQYVLTVYPASSLPDDPAGRIASVERLVVAGIIPPDRAAHYLDFPDLEGSFLSLDRAAYEQIEWSIEIMLDEGRKMVPHPFMDLQLALKLVGAHLLQAEMFGAPEDRLQLLRDYAAGIKVLHDRRAVEQQRAAMEAGAATGGMRSGVPGAPPAQGVAGVPPTAVGGGEVAA